MIYKLNICSTIMKLFFNWIQNIYMIHSRQSLELLHRKALQSRILYIYYVNCRVVVYFLWLYPWSFHYDTTLSDFQTSSRSPFYLIDATHVTISFIWGMFSVFLVLSLVFSKHLRRRRSSNRHYWTKQIRMLNWPISNLTLYIPYMYYFLLLLSDVVFCNYDKTRNLLLLTIDLCLRNYSNKPLEQWQLILI